MPFALILSSFVAASRVGGGAQELVLARFGVDAAVVPTVVFGRHPGWGPPGGSRLSADIMSGVLDGIAANGLFALTDLLISGYFVDPDQVAVAARTIDRVRAANPAVKVFVDPVLGDTGRGFFVSEDVCRAVASHLVPRADVITPNLFELEYLAGRPLADSAAVIAAARDLGPAALVTSALATEDRIGALYVDRASATLASHRRLAQVPQGTGDLLCALFAAAMLEGLTPAAALDRAVRGMAEAVEAAELWKAPELPIVALGDRLVRPTAEAHIEALS